MKVGVLALQGGFRAHHEVLRSLDAETTDVRAPEHLAGIDAMVLPGGESTTMTRLLRTSGLTAPLAERVGAGLPVLATCAGLILCSRVYEEEGRDPVAPVIGGLDVTVARNGYGTQAQSFEADLAVEGIAGGSFRGVFIRAPVIVGHGVAVEVLARVDGRPVLCRQGAVMGACFHPELADDLRLHQRFLALATGS